MNYNGVLHFSNEEYTLFMSGYKSIGYKPENYHFEKGKTIIVNECEIVEALPAGRFLVMKKHG